MVKKHFFWSSVATLLLLLTIPLSASALAPTQDNLSGGSNASDYQPPTGNPQNNVGGVSQGETNQNNLQKPEVVDQTALPIVPDLRVSGVNSQTNGNTTKTEVSSEKNQSHTWAAILFGTAAVAAVVLVVSNVGNRKSKTSSVTVTDQAVKPSKSEPRETDPVVAKKTTKRKKTKNKKSKRKR